jgi:FkbM family methyltransferase
MLKINQTIARLLHSLVHRSGVMIDVRNQILISKFEISKVKSVKHIEEFINCIVSMTTGVPLELIGSIKSDGSYPVALANKLKTTRLISIGVGNNMKFDEEVASRGAYVWLYDHTITATVKKKYATRMSFSQTGVRGKDLVPNCLTLDEIVDNSNNGCHFDQTILKIDCEGNEWDALLNTSNHTLSKIDQICGEFHNLDGITESDLSTKYFKVLQKLQRDFVVTYIAVNNFTPTVNLSNGLIWPFTIEIHLLNKTLLQEFDPSEITPGHPNKIGYKKLNWHLGGTKNLENWYMSK